MAISDDEIQRCINKSEHLSKSVQRLEFEVDRLDRQHAVEIRRIDEKYEATTALLVEIKTGLSDLGDKLSESIQQVSHDNRQSIHEVHKRVDEMREHDALHKGIERGKSEQRATIAKWIAAIVGLIAIFGYLNPGESAEPENTILNERRVAR